VTPAAPLRSGAQDIAAHLRKLAAHSAVYGAADVFQSLVNFLLVPVYTAYLTAADYGTLALLLLFGTVAKIVFRLGLDAGFFRVHYDLETEDQRRRLAGTVAVFAAGVGAVFLAAAIAGSGTLARLVLDADTPELRRLIVVVAADLWLGTFAFVPLALLRIHDRPGLFSALAVVRHAVNIALKVALLVKGLGVAGVVWSDAISTGVFSLALLPILRRHAAPAFSWTLLAPALRFGVPKVPHGILVQALNLADRKILDLFVSRAEVGIYQLGYTFGGTVKFGLSAFEPAWQPFVYAQARRADAPTVLSRVVTWAFGAFVAVCLAVAVLGGDLLVLMTPRNPAFWPAAAIVPVVALAYLLHGAFLLGSVGIGIEKRARYYPMITAAAAAANVGGNFLLIPRFGTMGAAWATVLSYAVMAGLGVAISSRLYPIPFETGRLAGLLAAAALAYAASLFAPTDRAFGLLVKLGVIAAFALGAWALMRTRHPPTEL
jgi:O-antigen/teichoic acid export membrane protein